MNPTAPVSEGGRTRGAGRSSVLPVDGELWSAYDQMGDGYRQHAEDGPYNAHDDRPAVLGVL